MRGELNQTPFRLLFSQAIFTVQRDLLKVRNKKLRSKDLRFDIATRTKSDAMAIIAASWEEEKK